MATQTTRTNPLTSRGALLFVVGAAAGVVGLILDPHRSWASWLLGALMPLTIAAGAAAFVAINYLSNAGWINSHRRIPEAMMAWLPFGGIILLVGAIGGSDLFGGGHGAPAGHDVGIRTAWLEPTFLLVRLVVIVALWAWLAGRIRRASYAQDRDGEVRWTQVARNRSALFIVVFAITFTAASFDWIMSLDHGFYSTIFAFYTFSGAFVSGMAAMTILAVVLSRRRAIPFLNGDQLHNLGKLLFAFVTFWGYLWFCQYMLIYYADIPEEVGYYIRRTQGGWEWLFWGNLIISWLVPFVLLLGKNVKRNPIYLLRVAVLILVAHWIDLYVMIAPAADPSPLPSWADIGLSICFTLAAVAVTLRAFGAHPAVPTHDPYLCEVDMPEGSAA